MATSIRINVLLSNYGEKDPLDYVYPFKVRLDSRVWDLNLEIYKVPDVPRHRLHLWKLPYIPCDESLKERLGTPPFEGIFEKLRPLQQLSEAFPDPLDRKCVHIFAEIQLPGEHQQLAAVIHTHYSDQGPSYIEIGIIYFAFHSSAL